MSTVKIHDHELDWNFAFKVTEYIVDRHMQPSSATMLMEYLIQRSEYAGDRDVDLDLYGYDGPEEWDISQCMEYLYDEEGYDGLERVSEWNGLFEIYNAYDVFERGDNGEEVIFAINGIATAWQISQAEGEDKDDEDYELDPSEYYDRLWDLFNDSQKDEMKGWLRVHFDDWADDPQTWRAAVGEIWSVEVYEWYRCDDYFAKKLRYQGEVVAEAFGDWYWGRQGTGQHICMDYTMMAVCANYWHLYVDEFPELKQYTKGIY